MITDVFCKIINGELSRDGIIYEDDDFIAIFTLGASGLISLIFACLIYRFGFIPAIILAIFLSFEVLSDVIFGWRLDLIRFLKIIVLIGVWLAAYELWKSKKNYRKMKS